jgi:hypothetical protein
MSISLSPRSPGTPANPTRQQLDELDALLQRMLDLPVNKLDKRDADRPEAAPVSYAATDARAGPAEGSAAPTIDGQAPKGQEEAPRDGGNPVSAPVAASPPATVAGKTEAGQDEESWVPLSSTWQPSALTWKPLARSWKQPGAGFASAEKETVATEAEFGPKEPSTPVAAADIIPRLTEPDSSSGRYDDSLLDLLDAPADLPIARWATVLVWFNSIFDLCLAPLGAMGHFFRLRAGRLGLAILGLGCLVAAAVVLLIDWAGWTS